MFMNNRYYHFLHALIKNQNGLEQQQTIPAPQCSCVGFSTSICEWTAKLNFNISFHLQRTCYMGLINTYGKIKTFLRVAQVTWHLFAFVSHNWCNTASKCKFFDALSPPLQVELSNLFKLPSTCLKALNYSSQYSGRACITSAKLMLKSTYLRRKRNVWVTMVFILC